MHAWLCREPVGIDALEWAELPTPQPGPGEVLVAIRAASLNFPDVLLVQNKYQVKPDLPFVPGSEYAGVVQTVGSGVTGFAPGQRVACATMIGGFATHHVAQAAQCVALPDGFDFVDGSAFILTYGTTHHALLDRGALQAGETLLILGAAGGVGTAAIEIGKKAGARVIAAASSDAKCALCRALGADVTVNYTQQPLRAAIAEATAGKGPDVIYDPVGGALSEPAFRSIAWRGRHVVVGFAAGDVPKLPLNLMLLKGASVVGAFYAPSTRLEPELYRATMAELVRWHGEGAIKPAVQATLPMGALKEALRRLQARSVMGKLVLVNDGADIGG